MLSQNHPKVEKEANQFDVAKTLSAAFKAISLKTNVNRLYKARGTPLIYQVELLICALFGLGDNIWRLFDSKKAECYQTSKTALYNLRNKAHNWRTVTLNCALSISRKIQEEIRDQVYYLIIDDSPYRRDCSNNVELLARTFDHVTHQFYKGFHDLMLGWSDGITYLPIDHTLLASANPKNLIQGVKDPNLDGRTTEAKRRKEAITSKTKLTISMVKRALKRGFCADYVLMDSWFSYHSLIKSLLDTGIHVICMMKDMKSNTYFFDDDEQRYTLKRIIKLYANRKKRDVCGSVIVKTKYGFNLKLVFLKHKYSKKIITIASTDIYLSEDKICKHYASRWACECFFKDAKQFLKMEKGCQARSFDGIYAHISFVMIAYICLQWINRTNNQNKTTGRLYYQISEEVQSISFVQAITYILQSVVTSLGKILDKHIPDENKSLKQVILNDFIEERSATLSNISSFIKEFLGNISLTSLREVVNSN